MASSAATAISSHPGIHAPGAKASNNDGVTGGDSFADMLASVDAATPVEGQAAQPVPAAPAPQTASPEDAATDTDMETAEIPAAMPAGLPQPGARIQATADKEADKAKDEPRPEQPANDNMNAALLPQPAMPAPVQAAASQDENSGALAPVNAPQGAAPQPANDADAEEDTAAASQAAQPEAGKVAAKDVTPKQAAAKPAKPGEFKKALDSTKPDTVQTQSTDSGKDIKQADAKQADPQAADARTVGTPALPAAHANNNPQADAIVPATAAPAPANAAPATPALREAATPTPHHAPNLENLAVNIAAKAVSGTKQFDIRLDPPELGRVEVRLSIDASGKAEAHLTADQPQTLDLLRKDSTALTHALREAGLDVNQDGLNFSLRNQQQQAGQDQGSSRSGRAWRGSVPNAALTETANAGSAYGAPGLGLLDIKV